MITLSEKVYRGKEWGKSTFFGLIICLSTFIKSAVQVLPDLLFLYVYKFREKLPKSFINSVE